MLKYFFGFPIVWSSIFLTKKKRSESWESKTKVEESLLRFYILLSGAALDVIIALTTIEVCSSSLKMISYLKIVQLLYVKECSFLHK